MFNNGHFVKLVHDIIYDMIRLVLDTNVLVAAIRSRLGASFQLLEAWQARRFTALASVPLFFEYESVLKRHEHLRISGFSERDVDVLLAEWASWIEPVTLHYLWRPQLTDAKDELVLETAVNGHALAIVTFNVRDFEQAAARFEVKVWSPADILKVLGSKK
jgi:putative PIN family toxin of toxin-antitoxin system